MYKARSFSFTLLFIIIIGSSLLYAQEPVIRVFVSEKIELIDGRRFYLHTVEKGQTLYSIAVAYNRPLESIAKENNIVNNIISVGQTLKIPVDVSVAEPSDPEKQKDKQQIFHDVKKGETLYGISKKYSVSIKELERLNPFLKDGLKAGQRLVISEADIKAEVIEPIEEQLDSSDEYIIHIVQKKETLYSISNFYSVPVEDIIALNPDAEKGIRPKQNLKIPTMVKETKPEVIQEVVVEVVSKPISDKYLDIACPSVETKKTLHIALLIPLYLNEVADINIEFSSHVYRTQNNEYNAFNYIKFYQAFMLAVDSLKKNNLSANIYVYDVTDNIQDARNIIGKPELKNADLIIGPFYDEPFKVVANFAKDKAIKIINPYIFETSTLASKSNLINIAMSPDLQIERYVAHLIKNHRDKNIIIAHNNTGYELNIFSIFKKHWENIASRDSMYFNYTEVVYNRDGLTGIINNIKKNKINLVLSFSNNEAFISNFIRKLSEIQKPDKTDDNTPNEETANEELGTIVLYGLPSWQKYNNLELAYLQNLNYHYFSTSFVDYTHENTVEFVKQFRDKYKSEPDVNAFMGYDIAMYFLYALNEYGNNFQECINSIPVKLINSGYHFRFNSTTNSYDNTYLNFLKFNNYVLEKEIN